MIAPQEIDRLRKLEAKATPGPWRVIREDESDGYITYGLIPTKNEGVTVAWVQFPEDVNDDAKIDAEFVNEARNSFSALLDEIERLRDVLEVIAARGRSRAASSEDLAYLAILAIRERSSTSPTKEGK